MREHQLKKGLVTRTFLEKNVRRMNQDRARPLIFIKRVSRVVHVHSKICVATNAVSATWKCERSLIWKIA